MASSLITFMSHTFYSLLVKYILNIHHPSPFSLFFTLLSGEAEGADERRTQQASLWHGGQASVWVQWETSAAPERENGCSGGEGMILHNFRFDFFDNAAYTYRKQKNSLDMSPLLWCLPQNPDVTSILFESNRSSRLPLCLPSLFQHESRCSVHFLVENQWWMAKM